MLKSYTDGFYEARGTQKSSRRYHRRNCKATSTFSKINMHTTLLKHALHRALPASGRKKRSHRCAQHPSDLSNHEDGRRYSHRSRESRYHRHVLITASTRRALAKVKLAKRSGIAAAAVLAAASLLLLSSSSVAAAAAASATAAASSGGGGVAALVSGIGGARASVVAAVGAVCSLGLGTAAGILEGHFYNNFERHPALV